MEFLFRVIVELFFIQTARLFLRLFGVVNVPEWAALILGMMLWGFAAVVLVALLS